MSRFNFSLSQAFKSTDYNAELPDELFVFHIGQDKSATTSMMDRFGITTFAYITAWNPYSQIADSAKNEEANLRLENELKLSGLKFFQCNGTDPSKIWPSEPGFIIFDCDRRWVKKLARRYRQHAIAYATKGRLPRLIWTKHQ